MAKTVKKSFVFNCEWSEVLEDYPAEVRLEIYEAVIRYASSGTISELRPLAKMAFSFIKKEIDYNTQRYNEVVAKRSAAGKKGMSVRYAEKNNQETSCLSLVADDNKTNMCYQDATNATDNDNDNEDDNEDVDDNDKENTTNVVLKSRTDKSVALKKRKSKQIIDYQYVLPEFKETFFEWLEYKKQRRESYKTEKSTKLCYEKLVKLSGNDPYTARQIVEQSMANNWAGLFDLKTENGNNRTTYSKKQEANNYALEQYLRDGERIARGERVYTCDPEDRPF